MENIGDCDCGEVCGVPFLLRSKMLQCGASCNVGTSPIKKPVTILKIFQITHKLCTSITHIWHSWTYFAVEMKIKI